MESQINYAVVDRVEESIAVLIFDDGTRLNVPDTGFSEGDVVVREGEVFRVDREETQRRREQTEAKRKRLFKRK